MIEISKLSIFIMKMISLYTYNTKNFDTKKKLKNFLKNKKLKSVSFIEYNCEVFLYIIFLVSSTFVSFTLILSL